MKREINPYCKDDLVLRLLDEQDLVHTLRWRNHKSHRHGFISTEIISKETHFLWFNQYKQTDNDFIFIICDPCGMRYGQLSFYNIDWVNHCAEFGRFLVNPDYSGLGIMKKACNMGLKLARCVLKLKKLTLEVKANNQVAIHIYQSNGFALSEPPRNDLQKMQIIL